MTRYQQTLSPDYFDDCYAGDPDPWKFTTSPYEAAKYQATRDALPKRHYASGLEIGCSIGVLTESLAPRCDALIGVDTAEKALVQARARCQPLAHVDFARGHVPADWPPGRFDLILLSEMIYFLDADDLRQLAGRIRDTLMPGGDVVLVHWTGPTHYPFSGDEASQMLIALLDGCLSVVRHDRTESYRLDVLSRGA